MSPFDSSGVTRGPDGIKRYDDLPADVVSMLRASVERGPQDEAVVELDGPRVSYQQLWDTASRVAGGLRRPGSPAATAWPSATATASTGSARSSAR